MSTITSPGASSGFGARETIESAAMWSATTRTTMTGRSQGGLTRGGSKTRASSAAAVTAWRVWRHRSRRDRAARAGHDGDAGHPVRRQFVHHRDDVAVGSVAVAAQLNDAAGVAKLGLDLR